MRKKIEVIVENAEQGHLSGYIHYEDDLLTSSADTLEQLIAGFQEQFAGFYDLKIPKARFDIKYNLQAFLEFHPFINASALADKLGWNKTLISQYKSGRKHPSISQLNKIEHAIHQIGEELRAIKLVA